MEGASFLGGLVLFLALVGTGVVLRAVSYDHWPGVKGRFKKVKDGIDDEAVATMRALGLPVPDPAREQAYTYLRHDVIRSRALHYTHAAFLWWCNFTTVLLGGAGVAAVLLLPRPLAATPSEVLLGSVLLLLGLATAHRAKKCLKEYAGAAVLALRAEALQRQAKPEASEETVVRTVVDRKA